MTFPDDCPLRLVNGGKCVVITFKKKECEAVVKLVSQRQVPGMCLLNYSFIDIFIYLFILFIYVFI